MARSVMESGLTVADRSPSINAAGLCTASSDILDQRLLGAGADPAAQALKFIAELFDLLEIVFDLTV